MLEGQQTCNPPVTHLVLDDATPRQGKFLDVQGDHVVVTYVKPAEDREGVIVRLVNLGERPTTAHIALPDRRVSTAWLCGTLEDNRSELTVAAGAATCQLPPRQITTVRLLAK